MQSHHKESGLDLKTETIKTIQQKQLTKTVIINPKHWHM